MSTTSSSSEDISKFAAVAVSADALEKQADESKKRQQRQQKIAQQRRMASLNEADNANSDEEIELLDAASLRVAKMLDARLAQDLDLADGTAAPTVGGTQIDDDVIIEEQEEEDTGGICLIKGMKIKSIKPIQQQHPITRPSLPKRLDKDVELIDCETIAVDADTIIHSAKNHAEQVKQHIVKVNPTSSEEEFQQAGRAKKRRLTREKLLHSSKKKT